MENEENHIDRRANIFITSTNILKGAYAQKLAGYKYSDGRTITHLLHQYYPSFLELNFKWVDVLLEVEGDIINDNGWSSLIYLILS